MTYVMMQSRKEAAFVLSVLQRYLELALHSFFCMC